MSVKGQRSSPAIGLLRLGQRVVKEGVSIIGVFVPLQVQLLLSQSRGGLLLEVSFTYRGGPLRVLRHTHRDKHSRFSIYSSSLRPVRGSNQLLLSSLQVKADRLGLTQTGSKQRGCSRLPADQSLNTNDCRQRDRQRDTQAPPCCMNGAADCVRDGDGGN